MDSVDRKVRFASKGSPSVAALDILEMAGGQPRKTGTDMGRVTVTLEVCHVLHSAPMRVGTCAWAQWAGQEIKDSSSRSFCRMRHSAKGLCPSAPVAQHWG